LPPMRHWLKEIEWILDFYFAYMLYNPNKRYRYHRYMLDKWGDRYKEKVQ